MLVLLAFLAVVVALGILWHAARDGTLERLASSAASHSLFEGVSLALIQDVALY